MPINIKNIIIKTKNNITDDNDKTKNKKYFIIDNILKKSIISYILNDKNILKHYDFSFGNQIYKLELVIDELIECVKFAKPYRSSKIASSTLHDHLKKLKNFEVFKKTYTDLLNTYLIKTPWVVAK
jgi:hypothetical protein